MKKRVWMAIICLCLSVGLPAQDSLKVNTKQIGVEDIVDVLNVMRVKMFHFDLMPFRQIRMKYKYMWSNMRKGKHPNVSSCFGWGKIRSC